MKNTSVVRSTYRSFVLVSILTTLTATLGMLIDNIIVGRFLGTDALGAMGVVSPISLIFSAVSNICSGGGTAHAAQALGRGDRKRVANIFTVTMLLVLLAGTVLTAVGMTFTQPIAVLLGAKVELLQPTVEYLRGFFLGAVPTIMTSALIGFVKLDGSTRLPLICIGVMTVSNTLLDLAMIFIFRLGMFGMALSTSISYCLAVLAGLTHFRRPYCTLRFTSPARLLREWGAIIIIGAPTALSRICDTVKVMTLNHLLVTAAGAGAVAALNVRTQTYNIFGALIIGVCQAILPVAGVFYGEEDKSALESTLKEALRTGLVLSAAAGLLLMLCPSALPELLGVQDGDTLQMATLAIRFFALTMPLQLINTAMMNFYQATHNPVPATAICLLQQLVFTTGFSLLLVGSMGPTGVWLAFLLGEGCTLAFIAANILLHNRGKLRTPADALLLKKDFGGAPQNRFETSLAATLEDVVSVSEALYAFGARQGLPRALMHKVVLCVEEMAGNIARHAFQPGKAGRIDLRVIHQPRAVIIRLRDNRPMFNPVAYLKEHAPSTEHLGLRIAEGIADRLEYSRTIGLNNLLMILHKPD